MSPYQKGIGTVQDDLRAQLGSASVTADQARNYVDDAVKKAHDHSVTCEQQLCDRIKELADAKAAEQEAQRKLDAKRELDESSSKS
jgi:polyhydroxyalkanoate synthesis regulator phasin